MAGWEPKTNKKHGASESATPLSARSGDWVIEKDIPIPPRSNGKIRTGLTALLRAMDIGDSVLVGSAAAWAYGPVSKFQSMNDVRFETRTTPDGLRIWRVE